MAAPSRPIVFLAAPYPAWRHQWTELPLGALRRRGYPVRSVSAAALARGGAPPWPPGSIVVAVVGHAGQALAQNRGDRVVVVLAYDVVHAPFTAERGLTELTQQLQRATVVVAVSEELVAVARTLSAAVVVHVPYAAPPASTWPRRAPPATPARRIGWFGIPGGREADFAELREVVQRLEAVQWVFWGDAPARAPEGAERYPYESIETPVYYQRLATLGLNVAVAPLAPTPFNASRSRAPFIEATVGAGCPLVASDFGPFNRLAADGAPLVVVPRHGWPAALTSLLERPDRRTALLDAARTWVDTHATIDTVADNWVRALEAAAA